MKYGILPFERIRNLRIDNNYSQTHIAKILNIRQNTYSQYETGVIKYPIEVFIALAKFYGVSLDYLTGLTDEIKPYPRAKNSNERE